MLHVRPILTMSLSALVFLIVQRIPEEERNAPTVASCILSACGGSLGLGAEIGDKYLINIYIFGSERSLRGADVVSLSVCGSALCS